MPVFFHATDPLQSVNILFYDRSASLFSKALIVKHNIILIPPIFPNKKPPSCTEGMVMVIADDLYLWLVAGGYALKLLLIWCCWILLLCVPWRHGWVFDGVVLSTGRVFSYDNLDT